MSNNFLFTSESVSEGHPDKIADQISDSILDAILLQDCSAKVACETYIKNNIILVGGEITTHACINIDKLVRKTLLDIGYCNSNIGFDADSCAIFSIISKQSSDICMGISDFINPVLQGAGDQGIVFGYANNDTDILMPAPIFYANHLMMQQSKVRKNGILPWLGPDAKSQVTCVYENYKITGIKTVVVSTQHSKDVSLSDLQEAVMEEIIKPVIPNELIFSYTNFLINPAGNFILGGPAADCGLTGRKIIVDTYGGMCRHGGGAFSGKDPSKMDRSAAYAARYIAKNIVAAGLAERCEIQIAYVIGLHEPISLYIDTFGTEKISKKKLLLIVNDIFDLTPYGIIDKLNLLRPIYKKTASYGHFGRLYFPWESLSKVDLLRDHSGMK